ncbi:auxin-responsive protein SAUR64-like [Silene latifolia]|uniref:auxin-responsive protein SAUR64-like n=1 Tax=Silene latifolia TaxID=37657 RepID=UPI003D787C8D
MARKWQKLAAASRRRISWPRTNVAEKVHFFTYANDGKRFMIPLTYLKSDILRELFRMAEEEFGLTSDGPIILPCDSTFMEYAISMVQRHMTEDFQKAFILSLSDCRSSSSMCLQQELSKQPVLLGDINFPTVSFRGFRSWMNIRCTTMSHKKLDVFAAAVTKLNVAKAGGYIQDFL